MKHMVQLTATLVIAVLALAPLATAEVPQMINYQGRLTDSTGAPVADDTYWIKFKIYSSESGDDSLWSSGFRPVDVTSGLFTYQLGSTVPLPDDLFATDTVRYLGVTVETDDEISPRARITSVAYAYQTLRADSAQYATVAATVPPGSIGATEIKSDEVQVRVDSICPPGYYMSQINEDGSVVCEKDSVGGGNGGGWADDGTVVRLETSGDSVGIGTDVPTAKLHVVGNARVDDTVFTNAVSSNSPLHIQTSGTTRMYIDDGTGNVGIGTTNPSGKLHVTTDGLYSAYFTSNLPDNSTHIVHSEYTGVSYNKDVKAVYGRAVPNDQWGFGGYFEGGYQGVYGEVLPTGSANLYVGVNGVVNGGSGNNYGVRGWAQGSGTNYGVWGHAEGDGTNYAGYFDGNVRVNTQDGAYTNTLSVDGLSVFTGKSLVRPCVSVRDSALARDSADDPVMTLLTISDDTAHKPNLLRMYTSAYSAIDLEFDFRGDGNAYADGSWNGGGADYAEWFEKEGDIPPASLIGLNAETGKMRIWQTGDPFIGVQSTNPGFAGNNVLGAEGTEEELQRDHVLVALIGQVEIESADIVEKGRQVFTSDGQFVGWRLSNGKVFVGSAGSTSLGMNQSISQQSQKIGQLNERVAQLEALVETLLAQQDGSNKPEAEFGMSK